MKVILTGGAGYIGTAIINRLNKDHRINEIVVYDNLSRSNRNFFIRTEKLSAEKVKFIQGDLLDTRKFRAALQGVDTVYHLAANVTTPFADQNPHLFEQVNHWGTAEVVYAVEATPSVKQLIYVSSASVYGASEEICRLEDEPQPETFYGISKLRAEKHIRRLIPKLRNCYILRCGNVYGYNKSMRFDAVINRFMFEANYKNLITINGTGEQHRPFIYIEKAAQALAALSNANLKSGTYNLVDQNLAIGEIVQVIRGLYPELEMIFVNQHMKMRELKVEISPEMNALFADNTDGLEEELKRFKAAFVF